MDFTARLKPLLKTKGVTWKQLSDELKIGRNQALYWQKNGTLPDGKTLIKLADYFEVSVDYLLGREEKKPIAPVRRVVVRPYDTIHGRKHLLNSTTQKRMILARKRLAKASSGKVKVTGKVNK